MININMKNFPTIAAFVFCAIVVLPDPNTCESAFSGYCKSNHFLDGSTANERAVKYGLRHDAQAAQRLAWIKNTAIPIVIRVIYDASLEAEYPQPEIRNNFIRTFFFSAQLIFEQPELYNEIKIQLVVISIEKLAVEFPVESRSSDILLNSDKINAATNNNASDLTVLLIYKNIYDGQGLSVILGQAYLGTFCQPQARGKGVIVNAHAINNALVFAHEIGHTLGIIHDDYNSPRECQGSRSIMWMAGGSTRWSPCSLQMAKNFLVSDYVFPCLYDQARLGRAIPLNPQFDFKTASRRPYPGEQFSLDDQCRLSSDKIARACNISRCDVCHGLGCVVDDSYMELRPALYGSECDNMSMFGRCKHQECTLSPMMGASRANVEPDQRLSASIFE